MGYFLFFIFHNVARLTVQKITRMKGTRGVYHVNVREDDQIGFREFHTFRTIKAAAEFIERAL